MSLTKQNNLQIEVIIRNYLPKQGIKTLLHILFQKFRSGWTCSLEEFHDPEMIDMAIKSDA